MDSQKCPLIVKLVSISDGSLIVPEDRITAHFQGDPLLPAFRVADVEKHVVNQKKNIIQVTISEIYLSVYSDKTINEIFLKFKSTIWIYLKNQQMPILGISNNTLD